MLNITRKQEHRIVDVKNTDRIGTLFFDRRWTEEIQYLSGMSGRYTDEYQVHYWNAIYRIFEEDQILDIAIPLVFYNYDQEIGGASIDFHLADVEEMSEKTAKMAEKKMRELMDSEFAKELELMFDNRGTWNMAPMNSIHCHPSEDSIMSSFSGTDYSKDIENPGVVFPLRTGTLVPNFASIMGHNQKFSEIVHTEYRVFTELDSVLQYERGVCFHIDKGYEHTPPEIPVKEPTWINEIFEIPRQQEEVEIDTKEREDKILLDGTTTTPDVVRTMMELWKTYDFVPKFVVDAKNLRKRKVVTYSKYSSKYRKQEVEKKTDYRTPSLFPKNEIKPKVDDRTRKIMQEDLIEDGVFTAKTLAMMSNEDIERVWNEIYGDYYDYYEDIY